MPANATPTDSSDCAIAKDVTESSSRDKSISMISEIVCFRVVSMSVYRDSHQPRSDEVTDSIRFYYQLRFSILHLRLRLVVGY